MTFLPRTGNGRDERILRECSKFPKTKKGKMDKTQKDPVCQKFVTCVVRLTNFYKFVRCETDCSLLSS